MEFYAPAAATASVSKKVSIPNGMEFYFFYKYVLYDETSFNSQRDGILLFATFVFANSAACFNSQRDGILSLFKILVSMLLRVSIPNGMEFYKKKPKTYGDVVGFNSQRDGILYLVEIAAK